jgi:putative ABC transport system permease protein
VPPNPRLGRVMNDQMKPLTLPADGLALSAKLAQVLHAHVDDLVIVEVMEGERPVREMRVTAIVEEFMGATAYMEISALNRLMHEGDNVSGAYMATDSARQESLYRDLKSTPRVASVSLKDSAIRSFKDTVVKNMLQMQWFNVCFAAIIAFGVVYNTARIALSERSRELATLRVIGFTRAEISSILLGELGVLTLIAIPVGMAIGYGMASMVAKTMDTELYRVPMVVSPRTYAFAATVVVIAAVLSGLVVRRKLDHLDLIAVLKSRD